MSVLFAALLSAGHPVVSHAGFASDFPSEERSISQAVLEGQSDVAMSLSRGPSQRSIERAGRGTLSGEVRLLRRVGGDVLRSAYRENGLEASADAFIADPRAASAGEWGAAALVGGSIALISGEFRLLRRVGEEVLRNTYQEHGIRAAADSFLSDPGAAGPAEWGAAALVGGSIALISGFRAETRIAAAKLRLQAIPALSMRRHYGSREFGRAELAFGRLTLAAALRRHAGRFNASLFGFDYKLRY